MTTLMERIAPRLVAQAPKKWCSFRSWGRPCDHPATTYLIGLQATCESGFACDGHAEAAVRSQGWQDARGS